MSWELNDHEAREVMALSDAERYEYFLDSVTDQREVWGLAKSDGWVLGADSEGHEILPVWPHPKYAEACALGDWQGATAQMIPLAAFMEKWLPGLAHDQRLLTIFPISPGKGPIVPPERLLAELQEELAKEE